MNNSSKKSVYIYQAAILPICLVIGFIFVSLRTFNEVRYRNFFVDFPVIFGKMFLYSAILYLLMTLFARTKAGAFVKKIFTVFEESSSEIDLVHIICGVAVFYLLYMLELSAPCDYPAHTSFAIDYLDWRSLKVSFFGSTFQLSYPMWHIAVSLYNKIFYVPPVYAAALASATFYTAEYCIVRKIVIAFNKSTEIPLKYIDLLCFAFMFLQPVYFPWFNYNQYLGQGTPNIWHNPTIVVCYPFAFINIFLFIKMLMKYKNEEKIEAADYIRMGLFLLMSVIAKPVFFQFFIPAVAVLFIIMIIGTKGKSFFFSLKFVISCIPAAAWAGYILFFGLFSAETATAAGIRIDYLFVWHLYTSNVPLSILLGCMFPIIYIITNANCIRNKSYYFIILCTVVAWLESALIAQNAATSAGDFTWGYNLSLTLLFCFTLADLLPKLAEKETCKKISIGLPLALYVLHFLFGTLYYKHMITGMINL